MEGLDEIIHQPMRLTVMAALNASPAGEPLEFSHLKEIARATDGNLGAHLATLEKAAYVEILKDYVGKRPRTRAKITGAGRAAFASHLNYLRGILDSAP